MRYHDLIAILPEGATGLPPEGLCWLNAEGMSAVLAKTPASSRMQLKSRKARLNAAVEYHRRLESLRGFGTVIPVMQNTAMRASDVQTLIKANFTTLAKMGDRLRGLDQYQISVEWNSSGVLRQFRDAPEFTQIFAAPHVRSIDLVEAIMQLKIRIGCTIIDTVNTMSVDTIELPCKEDMLTNLVILLPIGASEELDHAMLHIDAIWPEGLHIRQIGPAAAASFATLRPRWISPKMVSNAISLLDLGADATAEQIEHKRKTLLRDNSLPKETIDEATRVLCASSHTKTIQGMFLCDVWRDGDAVSQRVFQNAA